jgi:monoterpene epsilon-lactone hydrolase
MPSLRHELVAWAVPRVRRSRDLDTPERERARLERWHATLTPRLPTELVPRFRSRFEVEERTMTGPAGPSPCYVLTPRGTDPEVTLFHVHGGGYVAPLDPFHLRYTTRLALALGARVVLPTYPLAPRYSWRDSHDMLVDELESWADQGRVVLSGESAGGGIALALAESLRDHGGPQPWRLLLIAPWVDLTTSTPETKALDAIDPWLFIGKLHAYADWWAGDPADLGRPEVSPGLGRLDGLPPALMFCGTRDLLMPGCRLLADRAAATGWELTYLEAPGLLHVFPLLPFIPEARRAHRHTLEFLR